MSSSKDKLDAAPGFASATLLRGAGTDTAVLVDELKELHGAELRVLTRAESGINIAILPKDKHIEDLTPLLDEYLEKPTRRTGTATLTDAASFIAHVNRFKNAASAVFANPSRSAPSFTAVLDYHPAGEKDTAWMEHKATYKPELSDPWKTWTASNGKLMPQADFAAFIEEHITDIVVPNLDEPEIKTFAELVQGKFATPSDLFALSRGLAVNVETAVKNAIMLSSGEISVKYEETHKDGEGAPIQVANLFQICVPVFYAGALYRIAARLRYRIVQGKILWSYLLVRTDLVFDDAFRGIADKVRSETSAEVFLGSPEA